PSEKGSQPDFGSAMQKSKSKPASNEPKHQSQAPKPVQAEPLPKTPLPLDGAAASGMRNAIFEQAKKKVQVRPNSTPASSAPKQLGINPTANPKAAQALQQVSRALPGPRG